MANTNSSSELYIVFQKLAPTFWSYVFSTNMVTLEAGRPEVSFKNGVPGNFTKFTGKHLCQRTNWHRFFSVNFVKFLRTHFLQNTCDGCFCYSIHLVEIFVNLNFLWFSGNDISIYNESLDIADMRWGPFSIIW